MSDIYKQYRQSKDSTLFRQQNQKSISDHESAKEYFDISGYSFTNGNKLPCKRSMVVSFFARSIF